MDVWDKSNRRGIECIGQGTVSEKGELGSCLLDFGNEKKDVR